MDAEEQPREKQTEPTAPKRPRHRWSKPPKVKSSDARNDGEGPDV